jgi:hypothetical protein
MSSAALIDTRAVAELERLQSECARKDRRIDRLKSAIRTATAALLDARRAQKSCAEALDELLAATGEV